VRVEVRDAAFSLGCDDGVLIELLGMGAELRHQLVFPPKGCRPLLDAWRQRQSESIGELLDLVELAGLDEDWLVHPPRLAMVVTDVPGPGAAGPVPELTPGQARDRCRRPLEVLLEDCLTDRAALLCIVPRDYRTRLEELQGCGAIQFAHGGGLPNMVRQVAHRAQHAPYRTFAIFDSDCPGPDPGGPLARPLRARSSTASRSLGETCEELGVPFHQWERRSADNYLAPRALAAWAELVEVPPRARPRRSRSSWRRAARKVAALPPEGRAHYPMADGLEATDPEPIFIEAREDADLQRGFGRTIKDAFGLLLDEGPHRDAWFAEDGTHRESRGVANMILGFV